jgi:phosphoribosylformylglycinamidine cyclo-ligase
MLPIFQLLAAKGGVAEAELYQVFNMGIGMTMIVAADKADAALRFIRARGKPPGSSAKSCAAQARPK